MTTARHEPQPAKAPSARYAPRDIEPGWQRRWNDSGLYSTKDRVEGKENWFALTMFPYPSGDLHVGHWFAFTGGDVGARFKRMQGYNVLHPQGFDAFGLPAENAAISRNVHPRSWTYERIDHMRRQFDLMGNSYDWSRQIVTCDPEYYRWNQYFFLKLFQAGLAYRAKGPANWCPQDQTTLANEQVKDGECERCGAEVERRELPQWFFRITRYADEMLEMDSIDWPEKIKVMQRNWIGRSEGVTVAFDVDEFAPGEKIETFTTRIDTIYGVTFVVLAPEYPLVGALTQPEQRAAVEEYTARARRESEIERTSTEREKTGVFTGAYCRNPLNGERVPVLVGDYVLASYGTGAVMGVPAHDTRDFVFAKKYDLPIRVVVAPDDWRGEELSEAYLGHGAQVNSDEFDGIPSSEGMSRIADKIEANRWGRRDVTYHLRDWLISRQRYWGTPIPIVYCDLCGTVPAPEDQLPVLLPDQADFRPTGQSPLTLDPDFVNTECPKCHGPATRETDTMDTFMDSSWYHLRFTSPSEAGRPFSPNGIKAWAPVHQYTGGMEHAVMHLLYARFFNKALRDMGFVDFDEPYTRLFSHGVMTTQLGRISKRSNPLAPDPLVARYGADTIRCYLMFLGPWDVGGAWTGSAINGVSRWLNRVWDLAQRNPELLRAMEPDEAAERELLRAAHATTRKVINDMGAFKFNTSIAALMEYSNELARLWERAGISPAAWRDAVERLLLLAAPLAPHVTEELWERTGREYSIHQQSSPGWDDSLAAADNVTIVVQVNGRVRDQLELPAEVTEEEAVDAALASERVMRHTANGEVVKKIYVPGRLVNLVVRPG